jgi:EAL domain-containing protein (putative c-di-GMP-specific phosphodiesterase class I)
MGCRTAQGWLYAAALPGEQAAELIGQHLLPASLPAEA